MNVNKKKLLKIYDKNLKKNLDIINQKNKIIKEEAIDSIINETAEEWSKDMIENSKEKINKSLLKAEIKKMLLKDFQNKGEIK